MSPITPWLSSCGQSPSPETPARLATPEACVTVETHTFKRMQRYCGGATTPAGADVAPIDFFGPLAVSATTVTTFYIDAVAEFDAESGSLTRLLAARRSDSTWFAARGGVAVTPRCDGVLVVHEAGCQVRELVGHVIPAGENPAQSVRGMQFVSDSVLLSLGSDGTLRTWDVAAGTQISSRDIEQAADAHLLLGAGTGLPVISRKDSVEVLDPESLKPTVQAGPLSQTSGWLPVTQDTFAGVLADDGRKGILVSQGGTEEFIDTRDSPGVIGVSGQGLVAALVGPFMYLRRPSGQVSKVELGVSLYNVTAVKFSDDDRVVFAQDASKGVYAIDAETGKRLVEFEQKA